MVHTGKIYKKRQKTKRLYILRSHCVFVIYFFLESTCLKLSDDMKYDFLWVGESIGNNGRKRG